MEYRRLGRTGLRVSRVSLGTGGPQRLGRRRNASEGEIHRLIRHAVDTGITLFDTAPIYGESEALLGKALTGIERDSYVLATKFHPGYDGPLPTPDQLVESVGASLRRLHTDVLDLLQLHSVIPERYEAVVQSLYPAMVELRERGAIRFLGITESPPRDPSHLALLEAVPSGLFDVVTVVYNLLNPSAARRLLPLARDHDVGVIVMTAVRRALADPELLEQRIAGAVQRGLIPAGVLPEQDPLGWLCRGRVATVPEAAYKFAAAPPAVASVLTGTSRMEHLDANIAAVLGPPLPDADTRRLRSVFGGIAEPLAE